MMEAVHRYQGTVNNVMVDGIMAIFGAPVAHEDHELRACYVALNKILAHLGLPQRAPPRVPAKAYPLLQKA